jgi:triacylglycerol lipase
MVAMEWLATLLLFVFIQPFERWWMGADIIRRGSGRTTVVLVHGYCCNRGFWWWLRSRLRAHGLEIATLNTEPPFSSLDELTERLRTRLDALSAEAASEEVVLVGHSMGGLVASAYLRRYGPEPVTKLITLGTPHHGSRLARLGPGRNAREMEPSSDWLRQWVEAEPLPVPIISARSRYDNYVIPQNSSILTGARNIVLPAVGHLAMAFSSDVLRLLVHEITQAASPTSGEIGKRPKNAPRATAE